MNQCPCCGAAVNRPFIVDLNTNTITANGGVVKATPKTIEVAYTLLKAHPRTVSTDTLLLAIYGDPVNEPKHVKRCLWSYVWLLRRALKPFGWEPKFIHGSGYRLAQIVEGREK